MGTFKKGLVLGGLLGAALMWFNTTKKGKELKGEILDRAGEVYELVRERIAASEAWDTLTQSKYMGMVQNVLDEYSKQYGVSENIKNMIMKVVNVQWKNVQKDAKARRGVRKPAV